MIFTIGNVLVALYQYWWQSTRKMRYLKLIQQHVRQASIIFRSNRCDQLVGTSVGPISVTSNQKEWYLLQDGPLDIAAIQPQLAINLESWTSYLDVIPQVDADAVTGRCQIVLDIMQPEDVESFVEESEAIPPEKRVRLVDYAAPIAWKSGTPFQIVAGCTLDNLSCLAIAFLEKRLVLDDLLEIRALTTVKLEGKARSLLRSNSSVNDRLINNGGTPADSLTSLSVQRSWGNILDSLHSLLEGADQGGDSVAMDSEKDVKLSDLTSNESLASLDGAEQNQSRLMTDILSVGVGAAGDLSLGGHRRPDLEMCAADSGTDASSTAGAGAGEAPSDAIELLAPEMLTPVRRRDSQRHKPPNVLVYCGKKDAGRQYEVVRSVLELCLNQDKYVIYHLKHEHVQSAPWRDNSVLLVIASDKVYDGVDAAFLEYFMQGGTVISFGSAFDSQFVDRVQINKNIGVMALRYNQWDDVTAICGRHVYSGCDTSLADVVICSLAQHKLTNNPVILEACHELSGGVALLSQVHLDKDPVEMAISPELFATLKKANPQRFDILKELLVRLGLDCDQGERPKLTPCRLFALSQARKEAFLAAIRPRLQGGLLKSKAAMLNFVETYNCQNGADIGDIIPVVTHEQAAATSKFNFSTYRDHLTTKVLGQVVIFGEVLTTTMSLFDGLMFSVPKDTGVVCIASRQTQGQGRGGNAWVSPEGCAMFSVHVRVERHTELGQRMAYIQHIASLAVVEAVRSSPGCQDLDIRLKWPNDIYFGGTMKLGGVIVRSSIMQDTMHAIIGCGFNVSNHNPTVCINDLVLRLNQGLDTPLPTFTTEELIGRTLTKLEQLIALFQTAGHVAFQKLYYRRWLHGDAVVRLESEDGKEAQIIGLDADGYLSAQTQDGKTVSIHPDGNSFDMMKNLIVAKTR